MHKLKQLLREYGGSNFATKSMAKLAYQVFGIKTGTYAASILEEIMAQPSHYGSYLRAMNDYDLFEKKFVSQCSIKTVKFDLKCTIEKLCMTKDIAFIFNPIQEKKPSLSEPELIVLEIINGIISTAVKK